MVHAFDHASVAVVAGQIDVVAPPRLGRATAIAAHESVQVGLVGNMGPPLVVQVARPPLHLVQIAVRQVVLIEEASVHLLKGHVETPKIALVLGRSRLVGFIDHPVVEPMGLGRFGTHEVKELEGGRLEHALLAAMLLVTLLDTG